MRLAETVTLDTRKRSDEMVRLFAAFAAIDAEPFRTRRLLDRIHRTDGTWRRVSEAYGIRRPKDATLEAKVRREAYSGLSGSDIVRFADFGGNLT